MNPRQLGHGDGVKRVVASQTDASGTALTVHGVSPLPP
jgi:hypothetical protein